MSSYLIYYTEANVVCVIIFAIMLFRGLVNVDRQEKQIKYDHALVAFMLYFICDACWAAVIAGALPKNLFTVLVLNFSNYVLMAGITYMWLLYAMAVEQVPGRNLRRTRFAIRFPFYVATAALIVTYFTNRPFLLDDALNLQPGYSMFQIAVPCVYIAAIVVYTMGRAIREGNPIVRRKHLLVGMFPLMVVAGGLLQIIILSETPVFCFASAIFMLVFFINAMDTQISTDPLTGLNNRGQLEHYTLQKSNLHREGRLTFTVMFDINDFKLINDTYGHAEGDQALVVVANSMRTAARKHAMPMFLARYGGDEFILILHPTEAAQVDAIIRDIREEIRAACAANGAPYTLSIGAGYSQLSGSDDTFQACAQRADENLYLDKASKKSRR